VSKRIKYNSMAEIIKKIKNLFNQITQKPAESQMSDDVSVLESIPQLLKLKKVSLDETTLLNLMRQVEQTKEGTYSCDETFALLDEYVELVSNQDEAAKLMPLVEAHLDACSGCKKKYDILRAILNSESPDNS
jgi:elongation factor P--beta-lysine ligase